MNSRLHPHSQYYLHADGPVIYKRHGGVDPTSDFVVAVWDANGVGASPGAYLDWLKELKALGAPASELERLITEQQLTAFIPDARQVIEETSDAHH